MTTYGLTSTGFRAKPLSVILEELDAALKLILGESAGTEPDGSIPPASYAGQLKALMGDGFAALWDLLELIYASHDPNKAVDAAQDAIASITGALRQSAQQTSVLATVVVADGTVLPVGRVAKVATTGARFVSQDEIGPSSLDPWTAGAYYDRGTCVYNGTNIYVCVIAGTAAGAGGPTGTSTAIVDNTITWRYLAPLTVGSVTYTAYSSTWIAEVVGPVGALAGTLTEIDTPATGWISIVNPVDASVGRYKETNAAFRARRDAELAAPGNTTVDTIRANLLKVNEGSTDPDHEPPTSVIVFWNDTDYTDANGMPPHSVECLVYGGTAADIAQAIWDSVGAGTATYGSTTTAVTDSEGNTQYVNWSRPTEIPIYVTASVKYDATAWSANGADAAVKQAVISALLTFAEDWPIARDVRTSPLVGAIMRGPSEVDSSGAAVVPATDGSDPVPGLLEVETIYIGTSPSPVSSAQVPITRRQIATFDSARVVVTAAAEDP